MSTTLTGTKEWANKNYNIIKGCANNCRYCYAKEMSIRFKRSTVDSWGKEMLDQAKFDIKIKKHNSKIMYPSSHDITPKFINKHIEFLTKLLKAGNEVMIVSKAFFECIEKLCEDLKEYKNQISFRFTIGSLDSAVLKFWEPGASSFEERIKCLEYVYDKGFQTGVSCEPTLDIDTIKLINKVLPFVTGDIWVGIINRAKARISMNNGSQKVEVEEAYRDLFLKQDNEYTAALYQEFKGNKKIKWSSQYKAIRELQK